MKNDKIKNFEKKLKKEKVFLENLLSSFAKKSRKIKGDWKTIYPDFNAKGKLEEEASEEEKYLKLLPVEHALELKLEKVNLALKKIKEGNYGICEKCGKKISFKRLKIVPEAKFCKKCAKK